MVKHEFIPSDTNEEVCMFDCGRPADEHPGEITSIYDEDELLGSDNAVDFARYLPIDDEW